MRKTSVVFFCPPPPVVSVCWFRERGWLWSSPPLSRALSRTKRRSGRIAVMLADWSSPSWTWNALTLP